MSENEEQAFVEDEEHGEEHEDDLMNSFELGEKLDTDGLWYISGFGVLKSIEKCEVLWAETRHYQKKG